MIPNKFINDLLDKLDIVDLIGQYVPLKKQGANFTGLCPFHSEKTASFTVSPAKQFYHCFGCGAHGTAIGFIMQYLGYSFQDAVQDLANKRGLTIPIPLSQERIQLKKEYNKNEIFSSLPNDFANKAVVSRENIGKFDKKSVLLDFLSSAGRFYRIKLKQAKVAISYLKTRGVSGEIAAQFKLGYAPDGWQNLSSVFDDYGNQGLLDAGLVIQSHSVGVEDKKSRYDRFRNRIIFPITNLRGQVIAFGARSINGEHPKYLNSPETEVFTKGTELYALFEARRSIREHGYVLVVEGYMDVLMLVQAGFENAVATLGTACTLNHIQKLIRQTDRIVFCFDGDEAGRKAAYRALVSSLPFATDTREFCFIFLPDAEDPDSFIKKNGANAFHKEILNALPLSNFLVQHVLTDKNLDRAEGRSAALSVAVPLIRSLPAQSLRIQIIGILAERLKFDAKEIVKLCGFGRKKLIKKDALPINLSKKVVHGIEYRALSILLMFPHFAYDLSEEDRGTLLFCTEQPAVFKEILTQVESIGRSVDFYKLAASLKQSIYSDFFEEYIVNILSLPENIRDFFSLDKSERKEELFGDIEKSSRREFDSALAKLRYDACCKKLNQLSQIQNMTKDELIEFTTLSKLSIALKKSLLLN